MLAKKKEEEQREKEEAAKKGWFFKLLTSVKNLKKLSLCIILKISVSS